jgi:hypothetical protein
MMDEAERARRRAYIEETREMLARLDDEDAARAASSVVEVEVERVENDDARYRYGLPLADPHRAERWRAEALELEANRNREKKMTDAEWVAWADRRIAAALAEHARGTEAAVGEALGHERERHRDQLAKLEARIAALETKQRGVDAGAVVELPSPLVRKVRTDAA